MVALSRATGDNKITLITMTLVLFTISSSAINALALNRASFFCSKFMDHGQRERKRHDLTC